MQPAKTSVLMLTFLVFIQTIMKNLKNYLIERNYLYWMCQMAGYMPKNEDLFYELDWNNIKELAQRYRDLYKQDKKAFIQSYEAITELEMFINRKGRMYREHEEISDKLNNCNTFGKVREKMHDFNCARFNYDTEEGKYYFRTID